MAVDIHNYFGQYFSYLYTGYFVQNLDDIIVIWYYYWKLEACCYFKYSAIRGTNRYSVQSFSYQEILQISKHVNSFVFLVE